MDAARIAGHVAPLEAAVQEAARILHAARCPLIAGLAADVAGVSVAIDLARRLSGVADHCESAALLRDLSVMRRNGWIVTTPMEARARADVVVLVGPGVESAAREQGVLMDLLRPEKSVFRLCPDGGTHDLIAQLSLLRMRLSGRSADGPEQVVRCAEALVGARYAVVVWSALHLSEPVIESLCGLVEALNAKSRAAGLPIPPPANAMGASQVCAWLTGYPLPVGFVGNVPEHDPWRFTAARMIDSGEADAVLWIAALGPGPPARRTTAPMIVLAPQGSSRGDEAVGIVVGRPGVDHPGVVYQSRLAALASISAEQRSASPTAAAVLSAIMAALPSC